MWGPIGTQKGDRHSSCCVLSSAHELWASHRDRFGALRCTQRLPLLAHQVNHLLVEDLKASVQTLWAHFVVLSFLSGALCLRCRCSRSLSGMSESPQFFTPLTEANNDSRCRWLDGASHWLSSSAPRCFEAPCWGERSRRAGGSPLHKAPTSKPTVPDLGSFRNGHYSLIDNSPTNIGGGGPSHWCRSARTLAKPVRPQKGRSPQVICWRK